MNQDDNKAFLTTLRDINKEINNATDFTDSSVRHGNVFLPPIHHDENDTRNQDHTENLDTGTTATGPAPATTTNHMDQDLLQHTIADAGRWAFGSNYVELWVMNENHTHLVLPPGGWWCHPPPTSTTTMITRNPSLLVLTDTTNSNYVPPCPVTPGVGLPGVLWSELLGRYKDRSGRSKRENDKMTTTVDGGQQTVETYAEWRREQQHQDDHDDDDEEGQQHHHHQQQQQKATGNHNHRRINSFMAHLWNNFSLDADFRMELHQIQRNVGATTRRRLVWRNIRDIANDPDQAHDERLQFLIQCGLQWAAAVPFHIQGKKGIVIYMTRETNDLTRIQSTTNEEYLRSASDLIGSAWALREPRLAAIKERKAQRDMATRRARQKLLAMIRTGITLEQLIIKQPRELLYTVGGRVYRQDPDIAEPCMGRIKTCFFEQITLLLKKCTGGNSKEPPAFSWKETFLSFIGVFITFLMLTNFNEGLSQDLKMALPPFGALMTLQYGLTAAPASQPKNIIAGQIISMVIGIGFRYFDAMNSSLRTSC